MGDDRPIWATLVLSTYFFQIISYENIYSHFEKHDEK